MVMTKKEKAPKISYSELLKDLRAKGPAGVRVLWGEESYLRESYMDEIKKLCFDGEENEFSYHRVKFSKDDFSELQDACECYPFMTEYSLVEVRGGDLNIGDEAGKQLQKIFDELPEYCSLVFIPMRALSLKAISDL